MLPASYSSPAENSDGPVSYMDGGWPSRLSWLWTLQSTLFRSLAASWKDPSSISDWSPTKVAEQALHRADQGKFCVLKTHYLFFIPLFSNTLKIMNGLCPWDEDKDTV